jgi:hypothetical protein
MLSEYEHACTLRSDHRRAQKHPSRRRRLQLSSPVLRYCILRRLEIDLNITGVPENVLPEAAKLDAALADPDVDPPAARSSLFPTTPAPLGCTNGPTGAARDCFSLLLRRSRQRRRPLLHHLRSHRRRLRPTAPRRHRRPHLRRGVNPIAPPYCRSRNASARPRPTLFPTARVTIPPLATAPQRTRKSGATESLPAAAPCTFC